jgi:serine/arginine repetitive matrix protein 1
VARKHTYSPSVSPEERKYNNKQKARDSFTPDDLTSPERHRSSKQYMREACHTPDRIRNEAQKKKHSNGVGYESEEEVKYGPDPNAVMVKGKRSDDNDSDSDETKKHGRSHDREKKRHKKSHKHRKYSDESSESESSEESERESARRRRREEKRRLKREEKRRWREDRQRGKHKVAATATPPDADKREGLEEGESEKQKRLEIELKERALQSFRAKKSAATH